MTGLSVLAAAVFGGLGLAVAGLATATVGGRPQVARPAGTVPPRRAWPASSRRRAAAAVAAGVLVAVLTRWPVAAAAAAGLVACWPWLVGVDAAERAAIGRLEELATWTESLRDTIAGAVGLEQAIPATVDAAGPRIRAQLARLRGRLEARLPLVFALYALADDLADPSADLVVAALVLNAGLRGPGLQATLGALAGSARAELDMRRRVEAGRRGIRQGARIVVGVTVGFVAVLVAFNRDYLAPYGSPVGQLVLAAVVGVFGAGFGWLRHLSTLEVPARVLGTADHLAGIQDADRAATWSR